jgi:hypothetical protein
MEITTLKPESELVWRCVDGHPPWQDGTFRFEPGRLDDASARLRFWQEYAVELSDDAYGIYNFNWGTTWKASGCSARPGPASRSIHRPEIHSRATRLGRLSG